MGTLDHRAAFLLLGILIAAALMRRNNPLAFLAAIFTVTALDLDAGLREAAGARWRARRTFRRRSSRSTSAARSGWRCCPAILAILFTDLFDSLSTFIGVANAAGLTDPDGRPINLRRGLIVDAVATRHLRAGGHLARNRVRGEHRGHSHGRADRPRVGGDGALLRAVLLPRAAGRGRPGHATAAVLVLVGVSMFQSIAKIDFSSLEDALPAFVTVVLIPLTLSITQGILWGFLAARAALRRGGALAGGQR